MSHDDVQTWLDAYIDAWRTYDPGAIAALFTKDATYAYHPWDEGEELVRGRDAIVADWLEEKDPPGSWEAQYRPLLVEGEGAVSVGTTDTLTASTTGTFGCSVSTKLAAAPST